MKFEIVWFLPFLAFFMFVTVVNAIPFLFKLWRRNRANAKLAALGINEIDSLDGRDFERLLTVVFKQTGWKVELTPYIGDGGANLVVSKDGKRKVVQAKRSRSSVGVRAVQEVVASKPRYKADGAMVVTNCRYTKAAVRLARENGVELWGRNELIERLTAIDADLAA